MLSIAVVLPAVENSHVNPAYTRQTCVTSAHYDERVRWSLVVVAEVTVNLKNRRLVVEERHTT